MEDGLARQSQRPAVVSTPAQRGLLLAEVTPSWKGVSRLS